MLNIITVAVVGILLDVATGFIKALFEKNIDSSIIRLGGKHKVSELLIILFSFYIEKGLKYISIDLPFNPVTLVCGYIIVMECISIIENIGNMNSKCIPPRLSEFFKKLSEWKEIKTWKFTN